MCIKFHYQWLITFGILSGPRPAQQKHILIQFWQVTHERTQGSKANTNTLKIVKSEAIKKKKAAVSNQNLLR